MLFCWRRKKKQWLTDNSLANGKVDVGRKGWTSLAALLVSDVHMPTQGLPVPEPL